MQFAFFVALALCVFLAVYVEAAPAPAQTQSPDQKALAKQRIAARQFNFRPTTTTAPAATTTVQPTGQAVCTVAANGNCASCPNCPTGYTCKTSSSRGSTSSTCQRNSVFGYIKRSDGTIEEEVEQEYWL